MASFILFDQILSSDKCAVSDELRRFGAAFSTRSKPYFSSAISSACLPMSEYRDAVA